jgi:hypothetical protein
MRKKARAAIAAMREPTDGMMHAWSGIWSDLSANDVWQAMIDEALKP